jgi:phosphoglycolate phosphatase
MTLSTVFSDLDGTLVDTSADVLDAFALAFQENDLGHFPFDRSCIGPPAITIIRAALPQCHGNIHSKVLESFRKHHDSSNLTKSRLFPGVDQTILRLKDAGIKFFVITNKPRAGIINCVERLRLPVEVKNCFSVGDFFTQNKTELIATVLSEKKLDPCDVIMVGDTDEDITSALKNDVKPIYCSYGFGNPTTLNSTQISSISSFSQIVQHVFPLSTTQIRTF